MSFPSELVGEDPSPSAKLWTDQYVQNDHTAALTYERSMQPCTASTDLPVQLHEEDELTWDDGSVNPEPCLDEFKLVSTVRPPLQEM